MGQAKESPILVAGTVVADRFQLVRRIGHGGMGTVWRAQHTGLDIPCALKIIRADDASSPMIRTRFEREAKAAAQIRSPHVVQVLDYGVWEGVPYMAMELLEGEDLHARLERLERLDALATASITAQVARALTKAHAGGLVHRDLKPANIFLVRDDDREIAKVLDFGIVKTDLPTLSDHHTTTGLVLGTPNYLSPEQAQGTKTVDHRSDLWALGVVVFRCLTGRLPFQSEALGDLLLKIIVEPLPVPSSLAEVPPGFDAWWERAAARDPEARFQSARELTAALVAALGLTGSADLDAGPGAAPSEPVPPLTTTEVSLASGQPALSASTAPTSAGLTLQAPPRAKRERLLPVLLGLGLLLLGGGVLLSQQQTQSAQPSEAGEPPMPPSSSLAPPLPEITVGSAVAPAHGEGAPAQGEGAPASSGSAAGSAGSPAAPPSAEVSGKPAAPKPHRPASPHSRPRPDFGI